MGTTMLTSVMEVILHLQRFYVVVMKTNIAHYLRLTNFILLDKTHISGFTDMKKCD